VDGLSKTFKGDKLQVKDVQLEGAAYLTNKGAGLLAYEVGVGKTLTGILATVQQLQLGRAKKPVIVVPKATYKGWLSEIRDLFPNLKINELDNLRGYNKDNMPDIKDGTLSICTYQALDNLTFKDDTLFELSEDLEDTMANPFGVDIKAGSAEEKRREKERERIKTKLGEGASVVSDVIHVEDLGFDHITVDEAHNFKNVFSKAEAEKNQDGSKAANEYSTVTGSSSVRGSKMFMLSQYIQRKNEGRNVFMLTATPFTNSPLEIYNMLSFMARDKLKEMGIYNINQFLSAYAKVQDEWAVSHTGQITKKGVIKEFHNVGALQKLIKQYIDFKGIDDINERAGYEAIKRPKKFQHLVELPNNPELESILEGEQRRMTDIEEIRKGGVLKGINTSRTATLSPALVASKLDDFHSADVRTKKWDLVEDSPKLKFSFGLTAEMYKKRPDLGHVIYIPQGVEKFKEMTEHLVKQGVPKDAIATIHGGMSGDKGAERIEAIKKEFNDPDGKIKVLIGSSTILEGINLNGNTAFLHNTMLGWNASETVQLEGRSWRQGNRQENVHIITPVIHDSIDSVMYQKHDEKKSRFAEIHNFKGDKMDAGEIDYKDVKFDLIKDPEKKAQFRIELETERLNDQKLEKRILKDGIGNIAKQRDESINEIPRLEEDIKEHDQKMEELKGAIDKARAEIKEMPNETDEQLSAIERKKRFEVDYVKDDYDHEKRYRDNKKKKIETLKVQIEVFNKKMNELGGEDINATIANLDQEIDEINNTIKGFQEKKSQYVEEAKRDIERKKKVVPGVNEQITKYAEMLLENVEYSKEYQELLEESKKKYKVGKKVVKAHVLPKARKEPRTYIFGGVTYRMIGE